MNFLEIVFYTTENGRTPFLTWLERLDKVARGIVKTRLDHLRLGNFGDCKLIKNVPGLWELRVHYGPGYRIYFGKIGTQTVLLLIGGIKGAQTRDIMRARNYWAECGRFYE